MGVDLEQRIEIKWNSKNKKYYIEKGYIFTQYNDIFKIGISDLCCNSNIIVKCTCDYCGKEYLKQFGKINPNRKFQYKSELKIACKNCQSKKVKDITIEKYGVNHTSQLISVKNKVKETNLQKYGSVAPMGNTQIKEKYKQTCMNKYGTSSSNQSNIVKEKIKQTMLERHGVIAAAKNPEIYEKVKQTNLQKYGCENSLGNVNVRKKAEETMLKRYGTKSYAQTEECKEKMKQTCIKKYNVPYYNQTDEFKEKFKQTMLKKYGVEYSMHIEEVKRKVISAGMQTMYENGTAPKSRPQTYIYNVLNNVQEYKFNYPFDGCLLDIANLNEKVYIEYDGGGHSLNVKFGQITKEEFNKIESDRYNHLRRLGWKMIRIISTKDLIPRDEDIINLINNAKNYLLNSNHTWYKIDIDKKQIECREYIKPIELNDLRRITKQILGEQKIKLNIKDDE